MLGFSAAAVVGSLLFFEPICVCSIFSLIEASSTLTWPCQLGVPRSCKQPAGLATQASLAWTFCSVACPTDFHRGSLIDVMHARPCPLPHHLPVNMRMLALAAAVPLGVFASSRLRVERFSHVRRQIDAELGTRACAWMSSNKFVRSLVLSFARSLVWLLIAGFVSYLT